MTIGAQDVEGQTLRIEVREAERHYERLPDLAADLINRRGEAFSKRRPEGAATPDS
jgi:hypothetical protein